LNTKITNTAFGSGVFSIKTQSDGKIICGGEFTNFNGVISQRIARLNSNGSLDTNFTTNIGFAFNSYTASVSVQADNKILVGGNFTSFKGETVNRIARLNSDGTLDTSFTTNTGTGFDSFVSRIAVQTDDKLVIGGNFSSFNGTSTARIARLNSNGTLDTSFTANIGTGFDGVAESIAIQSDGKMIIGGTFTTFNGTTVNRIVRLNSDGTRDMAFTTNTGTAFNGAVRSVEIKSDGKIICGGEFTTFNGATVNYLACLNSDGTRDTTFTANTGTGFNDIVISVKVQPDGKIIIGGRFKTFNSTTVNHIVRLNSDGTRDSTFTTNTGT
jgi:uncharacterized delta-60 repeat protein